PPRLPRRHRHRHPLDRRQPRRIPPQRHNELVDVGSRPLHLHEHPVRVVAHPPPQPQPPGQPLHAPPKPPPLPHPPHPPLPPTPCTTPSTRTSRRTRPLIRPLSTARIILRGRPAL